jgi:hypothetical protein
MKKQQVMVRSIFRFLLFILCGLLPMTAREVNTVNFSASDVGVTKAVAEWGVDTAWPSFDNVRQSIASMGINNVDVHCSS